MFIFILNYFGYIFLFTTQVLVKTQFTLREKYTEFA